MIKYGLALIATASISLTALAEPYSPAVRDTFPDNVYWGDTHVHTFFSGDAYSMGNSVTPDEAYRFARGETIRATGGEDVRLQRPLDFLMVADHAENLGVLPRLVAGDARLMESPHGLLLGLAIDELGYILPTEQYDDREYRYERSMSLGRGTADALVAAQRALLS